MNTLPQLPTYIRTLLMAGSNWKRLETRDPTKARRYEGFKVGRQGKGRTAPQSHIAQGTYC